MSVPASGPLSIGQLAGLVNWTTAPFSMSGLYRGGLYIPSSASASIPTSGTISVSNFRGVSLPAVPYIKLDASALTASAGTNITSWPCTGSWGKDFVANATTGPQVRQFTANGKSVKSVYFDLSLATRPFMRSNAVVSFNTYANVTSGEYNGGTFVFVMRLTRNNVFEYFGGATSTGTWTMQFGQRSAALPRDHLVRLESGAVNFAVATGGVLSRNADKIATVSTSTPPNLDIFVYRFDNSAQGGPGPANLKTMELIVNSRTNSNIAYAKGSNLAILNRDYGTTTANAFLLGTMSGTSTEGLIGWLSEFQVYKKRLTDTELDDVLASLRTKWSVPDANPTR